jgi:uncharacterized protein involved in exopolysaccharide biosynthesis
MNDSMVADLGDELDVSRAISLLWGGRWLFLSVVAAITALTVTVALLLPDVYRAEATLAPAADDLAPKGIGGNLGGVMGLAGINLGGSVVDKTKVAIATAQSREFLIDFIRRHKLVVPLMAAQSWNPATGKLSIDPEKYDVTNHRWVRRVDPPRSSEPSSLEAYEAFRELLEVSLDEKTGLILLSVDHVSPVVAKEWADLIIADLNAQMSSQDAAEAGRSVGYLRMQLKETSITDIRNVFYGMIGEQIKIMMLAQAKPEYAFKIIDPPYVTEKPAKPNRPLLAVAGLLVGLMLGLVVVIGFHLAGYRFRGAFFPRRNS